MENAFCETGLYERTLTKLETMGERIGFLMRNKIMRLASLLTVAVGILLFGSVILLRAIFKGAKRRN